MRRFQKVAFSTIRQIFPSCSEVSIKYNFRRSSNPFKHVCKLKQTNVYPQPPFFTPTMLHCQQKSLEYYLSVLELFSSKNFSQTFFQQIIPPFSLIKRVLKSIPEGNSWKSLDKCKQFSKCKVDSMLIFRKLLLKDMNKKSSNI